jgi:hypothetical protein
VLVALAAMLAVMLPGPGFPAAADEDSPSISTDVSDLVALDRLAVHRKAPRDELRARAQGGSAAQGSTDQSDSGEVAAAQSGSGSISGVVRDVQGRGIDEICVAALNGLVFDDGIVEVTFTDATGAYRLEGLPGDSYILLAVDCSERHDAYAYAYWPDAGSFMAATPIVLDPGVALRDFDMRLADGAAIDGHVVDAAVGVPLGNICVAVVHESFELLDFAWTDGAGRYRLSGLRGGDHLVAFVDCQESPAYAMDWWQGSASHTAADVLRLEQGQGRSGIDAALVMAGEISGTVIDRTSGGPVQGVCSVLLDGTGQVVMVGESGADGHYLVHGVRPGDYRVVFLECDDARRYTAAWYDGADSWGTADPVRIQAGVTTGGINATLDPDEVWAGLLGDLPVPEACPDGEVPASGFRDLAGNVHEAAIDCVAWWEITRGVSADEYGAARTVRRDQMASFLARMLEAVGYELPPPSDQGFTDIAGSVHEDRINQLAEVGVTMGTSATTYSPGVGVRRDQMASFLVRTYETFTGESMASSGASFTDTVGNFHEVNIAKVADAGIAQGVGDGRYEPAREVRRDQMASFLARTVEHIFAQSGASGAAAASGQSVSAQTAFADWQAFFVTRTTGICRAGRIDVQLDTRAPYSGVAYAAPIFVRVRDGRSTSHGSPGWIRLPSHQHTNIAQHPYTVSSGIWEVWVLYAYVYSSPLLNYSEWRSVLVPATFGRTPIPSTDGATLVGSHFPTRCDTAQGQPTVWGLVRR